MKTLAFGLAAVLGLALPAAAATADRFQFAQAGPSGGGQAGAGQSGSAGGAAQSPGTRDSGGAAANRNSARSSGADRGSRSTESRRDSASGHVSEGRRHGPRPNTRA